MAAGPVEADSRIELVDALRGFALAGVLFVNLRLFTQYDFLTDAQYAALGSAAYDDVLSTLAQLFADGKFVSLFSMLFGYGFSLQIARLEARGAPALKLYIRRIVALLLLGLVHSLLWWGDILRFYALTGFVLVLTRHWPARRLAWTGLALAVVFAIVPTTTSMGPESDAYQRAYTFFSGHSFLETFRANRVLDWFEAARYPWLFPFVLSRFLIGSAAGKAGVLADPAAHRSLLRRAGIAGVILGVIATIFFIADVTDSPLFVQDAQGWNLLLGLHTIGFAVAYASWFSLLFIRPRWHAVLRHLAPVGRMCLTNYLTQTIVCVIVFYGFGFGVGPRFGMPGVFAAWAIIFGAQIIVSPIWLARFRFGPAEWVWRMMTYGTYFKNAAI